MDQVPSYIFALVLLALALCLTGPFSFTIVTPSSEILVCGVSALVYLFFLQKRKSSKEAITPEIADFPGYQSQPPPKHQTQPSNSQQQSNGMGIWVATVHSQRDTILRLHDQVLKEKRNVEYLDLRLKKEQKRSASQHSIATKLPNAGDARKVLELKRTIVDLTYRFQNLESTFHARLEESRRLIRPGFAEEVKENWILLSRYDQWQAWKEVNMWCQNHGLMVVTAGTCIFDDSVFGKGRPPNSSTTFPAAGTTATTTFPTAGTTTTPTSETTTPPTFGTTTPPTPPPTSRTITPPTSGTTPPAFSTTGPSTSGTQSTGLSTTQTTVNTNTTLEDPYPVSIKSLQSPKEPIILYIERLTGTLHDLDELWRGKCKASGQPSDGPFEWFWVDEEHEKRLELEDRYCPLTEHKTIPEENRRHGVTLSVENVD